MSKRLEQNGVVYDLEQNVWTGRFKLSVNGVPAERIGKRDYQIRYPDGQTCMFHISGNNFSGFNLSTPNGQIEVDRKLKVYEIILSCLPFLVFIPGVLFGAIGGGLAGLLGALGAYLNLMIFRTGMKTPVKILCAVGVMVAAFGLWFLLMSLFWGFETMIAAFDRIF